MIAAFFAGFFGAMIGVLYCAWVVRRTITRLLRNDTDIRITIDGKDWP